MAHENSHVSNLQPHILEYVTGVLWILAFMVTRQESKDVAGLVNGVANALKPLLDLKMPDLVIGFLVAIGGVVVPYALAMAFRPLTLWLMNRLLELVRIVNVELMDRPRRDLHWSSVKQLQASIGVTSDVDVPEQLAFIEFQNASIAANLEWSYNGVVFRAACTLPSAILFSALIYRFSAASLALSVIIGVIIFGLSAAYSIQALREWGDRAESLIMLYANRGAS